MSADSQPKTSDIELLEYTTLKSSYELLNKRYRKNHRELEKNQSSINRLIDDCSASTTNKQAIAQIDKLINSIKALKNKTEAYTQDEQKLIAQAQYRIDHLKQLVIADEKTTRNSEKIWKQENETSNEMETLQSSLEPLTKADTNACMARFYRLLTEHLFVNGYLDSAIRLAKSCKEKDLCLLEIFEECARIKEALMQGNTAPAQAWFQEVQYKLKKTDCVFEFDLRLFEFYRLLVHENKRKEALDHARNFLGETVVAKGYKASKLGQAMVLFVMRDKDSAIAKAEENELTEKWIVSRFLQVYQSFYEFSSATPLSTAIKAGVTAIKTVYCYNNDTKHVDCVVCHPLVNRLAKNLPYGRHEHSVLSCQLTNEAINDNNPAMMLPNGHVYSQQGLMSAAVSGNMVTCARTGEQFPISSAERVYIL